MTNGSPGSGPPRGRDTLGLRLALSFLAVALAAVALLAGLIVAFAATEVSHLVSEQRADLTSAVAAAAGAEWLENHSWRGAELSPAFDLASRTGADAAILDVSGSRIAASAGFAAQRGRPQFSEPVMLRGRRLGTVIVRFSSSGLGAADQAMLTALMRAVIAAAGLAALLALLSGLAVSRHLARPVAHIISVVRARGGGERDARVGNLRAPGEFRELAAALDQMAERLDRNEQLRRDLVADLAHELRTPVAVLQAGHEALLDGLAEPSPGELGSLRDEVLRLARMVDDLQVLAAADAAAVELTRHPCDLADIAATAADTLAAQFDAAGLTLTRDIHPAPILADPRWLHQVVTNLLTNSLKYTPAGGSVTIDCATSDDQAVLHVTDTGPGIAAADLPRIFDRFWRGRQALRTSGSGIGLAIAAELTRAHGGTLSAASEPGQGTRMTLALPLAGLADR
jgi:two-component system, OmpR family, sensor histidine kinase BaeS